MKRFAGIVSDHDIREAIPDLEELSEGAVFVSFDHSVRRRGMMFGAGPDEPE